MASKKKMRPPRARHPMQPVVVDSSGVHRYKENKIVRWMLDQGTAANHFSLNTIAGGYRDESGAVKEFPREDHEQLAQLIGYSVSGACDLSYMSDAVCNAALAESARIATARSKTKTTKNKRARTKRARAK